MDSSKQGGIQSTQTVNAVKGVVSHAWTTDSAVRRAMAEKATAEHVEQDLFEWMASIRDKLKRGHKPSYVYTPYKTKHNIKYGQDVRGKFADLQFKMPDGLVGIVLKDSEVADGELQGFRIYTEEE